MVIVPRPVPDNAIYHLAGALERLSNFGFPLKTNEVTAAYFQKMAKIEAGPVAQDLARVAEGSQEAMRRVAATSPGWNATLRTTCVATQLEGGHAINALPQLAAATVNCRVLPEDSLDYVQSTLQKVVAVDQVAIKVIADATKGPPSAMRPDVLDAVNRVTNRLWPGVPVVPTMVMGATDGRSLRAARTFRLMGSRDFSSIATIFASMGGTNGWPCNRFTKARLSCISW